MGDEYISPQQLFEQRQVAHTSAPATTLPPTVVDVRDATAYTAGHIPGALHIPIDDLPRRLEEIPRDRPVVPY